MSKYVMAIAAVLAVAACGAPVQGELFTFVNGDFSQSNDRTTTPPGWTNIGHTDGVIPNSDFSTPSYYGNTNFYDLGGYGSPLPAAGDGIQQAVPTQIGTTYTLVFGLSSENYSTFVEYLNVYFDGVLAHTYTLPVDSNYNGFQKPWTTVFLDYTATSTSTTIAFTVTGDTLGNNDPCIAGVGVIPEPATMGLLGLGLVGLIARRRRAK